MSALNTPSLVALFAQVQSNTPKLKEWLEAERDKGMVVILKNRDPAIQNEMRGQVSFINDTIYLLENASKHLR